MPLSTTELNRLANYITASDLILYAHTANPGTNGTTGRLTTPTVALDDANWSVASNGDVDYEADAEFGVLDSSNQRVITYWSVWRSTAFVASGAMASSVTVTAGGTFKINTGTIQLNGAST